MPLIFVWDKRKATTNLEKHGIAFEEAATVFADLRSVTISDPEHSQVEPRFITMGKSHLENFLVVVHTERGDTLRIISARRASRRERRKHEEAK